MGGHRLHLASFLSGLALLAAATRAPAVEPVDQYNIWIAGYLTRFDTKVRADGESTTGTPVDLEQDLSLEPSNVVATIGGNWRPWEHHQFGLSYYSDNSSSTRQIQRSFQFEGQTYDANATVKARLRSDIVSFQYTWWAAMRENWALGPQFGLIWYRFKLGLDMQLDVNGNDASGTREASVTANLPSPSLGVSWSWTPGEDWRVGVDGGYFAIEVDPIDARVLYGRAAVEWFPWENAGFRLDYTANDIEAKSDRERFRGKLNFLDSGIRLGFIYRH